MECRPFKDPSFDKYMLEQDTASQAIPDTKDTAAQTVQLRCSRTYIDFAYMALHPVELPMHLFVKLNLNTREHEIIFKVNFKDFSVWMGKPSLDIVSDINRI
jgi:hypothetical protein